MDLIIGGAYQGKLAYAREAFSLGDADISICSASQMPDFSRRCIVHFEQYVQYCLQNHLPPDAPLRPDAVVIAEDIFCGVVSTDEATRAWREETARILTALAVRSDTVTRVFCGLPQRLKG